MEVKLSPVRLIALVLLVFAAFTGCITETAVPDPVQIEAGLRLASKTSPTIPTPAFYAAPKHEPRVVPEVAIVVAREAAEAPPQLVSPSNLFAGKAIRVEMNPTQLVVRSMAAYMDDYARVSVVPALGLVDPGTPLILEPVITSLRWRTNGWRYAYFALRIEADLYLTLRDHTNGTEEVLRSGWVAGGTYGGGTTQTGHMNRVVRAVAHATAVALNRASVLNRLPHD